MEPVVLLYHIAPAKEAVIRALCEKLSVRMVRVPVSRHGCTIGEALRGEGADRRALREKNAGIAWVLSPDPPEREGVGGRTL